MALIKTISEIPTITQLYQNMVLRETAYASSRSFLPSVSINARVSLARGDITKFELDAVVNAANSALRGGGGVDGAIHRAAGPELLSECRSLGGCPTGDAVLTAGYQLPAKYVIHTVGPIYDEEHAQQSAKLLKSCYEKSLQVAVANGIKTMAFSCISTGVYGYPSKEAAEIACKTVRNFLESNEDALERVVFVTFERKDMAAYTETLP
ncbi:hypothetical protein UVI_02038830 [Ustilaginoidea virens]|nr:hypothetical protein UVI_02038830 [Ustilaginoidea virens]